MSDYLILHMNDHVRCLAQYFDVTVVNEDCDYAEICDRHKPDLALFESGFQTYVSRRPTITGVRNDNSIPKAGFHNADSWSDCRGGFLSDMDQWGIETFFSICTTTAEYIPAVREKVFVWPNFIDPEIFRDYGIEKTIPALISGKAHEQYPWRQATFPLVSRMLPCLILPQFDHGSALAHRTLSGAAYARALNASRLSLTCGTMAREVVRKHFEIPGAKAALVCEEAEALKAAGFVHMENCAFADADNVIDVIDHLLGDPDTLARITQAGYDLVHARHTLAHRPQILQWFELQDKVRPGQEIAQDGPFGDLFLQAAPRPDAILIPTAQGLDRALLRDAGAALDDGRLADARAGYRAALGYIRYLPEANFGLALCDLAAGDAAAASRRLAELIGAATVNYGASDPDPVEWAWFLLALAASGHPRRAHAVTRYFAGLRHPELRRARTAIARMAGAREPAEAPGAGPERASIHSLPDRTSLEWNARLAEILVACGERDLAERVTGGTAPVRFGRAEAVAGAKDLAIAGLALVLRLPGLAALRPNVPATTDFRYLSQVRLKARRAVTRSRLGARLQGIWRRRRAKAELKAAKDCVQVEIR